MKQQEQTPEFAQAVAGNCDRWVPACGGHEVACGGYLYVFNPCSHEHGWLDVGTDIVQMENPFPA